MRPSMVPGALAGFSLRVNRKQIANATHPDRDAQFQRIAAERARCAAKRVPIISVDTNKNELVGNFRNPGSAWNDRPLPMPQISHLTTVGWLWHV